jgi:hypothetical protein
MENAQQQLGDQVPDDLKAKYSFIITKLAALNMSAVPAKKIQTMVEQVNPKLTEKEVAVSAEELVE